MTGIKNTALGALYGLLTAWVVINWITGCGDFTRTIDGQVLHGQCVLVPWVN